MAYFNYVNNAAFYPASTAPSEFGAYSFLGQPMSANEEDNVWQTHSQFSGSWNMGGQPGYTIGGPTNLPTEVGFGKDNLTPLAGRRLTCGSPASVHPHPGQGFGYGEPPFPGDYWPADGQYAQSHHSGVANWDDAFFNTVAPTPLPTAGSGKYFFPLNPRVI